MADTEYPSNVSELRYPGGGELARIKMQPHSVEAEQSVLGGLLLSADGWDAVAELVTAGDFYRPGHRLIFRQIAQLAEALEPVDVITVADKLQAKGELDAAGGLPYLAELAQNTPSASNIRRMRRWCANGPVCANLSRPRRTSPRAVLIPMGVSPRN